jgi:hypothetical protein
VVAQCVAAPLCYFSTQILQNQMSIALNMDAIAEAEPLVGNKSPLPGLSGPSSPFSGMSEDDVLASDHDAINTEDSQLYGDEEEDESPARIQKSMGLALMCRINTRPVQLALAFVITGTRATRPVVLMALLFLTVIAFAGGYLSAYRSRKVDCQLRHFAAWPAEWNEGQERVNVTIFAAILTGMISIEALSSELNAHRLCDRCGRAGKKTAV